MSSQITTFRHAYQQHQAVLWSASHGDDTEYLPRLLRALKHKHIQNNGDNLGEVAGRVLSLLRRGETQHTYFLIPGNSVFEALYRYDVVWYPTTRQYVVTMFHDGEVEQFQATFPQGTETPPKMPKNIHDIDAVRAYLDAIRLFPMRKKYQRTPRHPNDRMVFFEGEKKGRSIGMLWNLYQKALATHLPPMTFHDWLMRTFGGLRHD